MESISSTKMFQKSEYKENGKIIRWTEVHDLLIKMSTSVQLELSPLFTCMCVFCPGILSAEGGSSQRRTK